jgi:hypothetical protein
LFRAAKYLLYISLILALPLQGKDRVNINKNYNHSKAISLKIQQKKLSLVGSCERYARALLPYLS